MPKPNTAALGTAQNPSVRKEVDFDFNELADIMNISARKTVQATAEDSAEQAAPTGEEQDAGEATVQDDAPDAETSDNEEQAVAEDATPEVAQESDDTATAEPEDEIVNGLPKGVKKRLDKLITKAESAEKKAQEALDKLQQKEAELDLLRQEASKPSQTSSIPELKYQHLKSEADVDAQIEQARNVRRICELNPNGLTENNPDGTTREYSAEEVSRAKVAAIDAIERDLPQRKAYIQQYRNYEPIVAKEYPFWNDKTSQEYQIAQQVLRNSPSVQQFPEFKLLIGDMITGMKARTSKQQAAGKTPTVPQKIVAQPKPTAAPVQKQVNQQKTKANLNRFAQSGDKEDAADFIMKRFLGQ